MKKILYIGSVDKTSVLLNLIKVVSLTGLKGLYVDGTQSGDVAASIPEITEKMDLIEFEGFDCALNKKHLNKVNLNEYDYIQIDIDNSDFISDVSLDEFDKIYIFSTLEKSALKRTRAILEDLFKERENESHIFTLIVNNYISTHMDEDFIYDFFDNPKILRTDTIHLFNFDEVDYQRYVENVHDERSNLKRFSGHYRKSLAGLLMDSEIVDEKSISNALKTARRG
ncbi:hypothetical protein ABER99_20035 [Paenibacillus glucanolyticus]|uniref:Uncharacterized protein n=1 Tax=Paenibacillus glucanolyticus TaxID=59843 RepID=A0A163GNF4_9BACL|nr:hypothetical protein [Paenibacillus glucanolyticus]KZS45060.1 hypothetical protein AWU65_03500 [Paenibacillus glucanolyticus]OMF64131.1 hypothetical protein BK142_32220 [Paenibacillus glucanolyticus]